MLLREDYGYLVTAGLVVLQHFREFAAREQRLRVVPGDPRIAEAGRRTARRDACSSPEVFARKIRVEVAKCAKVAGIKPE